MTTAGAAPWELGLAPSDDQLAPRVLAMPRSTYFDLCGSLEEFGSGVHRVLVGDPSQDPVAYVWSPSTSARTAQPSVTLLASSTLPTHAFPYVGYPYVQFPHSFPATYPTQADVLEAIEGLRSGLGLTIETTARLLGVERRTYHGWKSGDPMPMARLQTAINAVLALGRLAADDPAAARKVFEEETVEATGLVATGQFAALRALVDRVSAAIARQVAALGPAITAAPEVPKGVDPNRALDLTGSGEFEAAITFMEALAPETRASAVIWKVRALLALQAAVVRLSSGDELGETWLFLTALSRSRVDDLEQLAFKFLQDSETSAESWEQFLTETAQEAWSRNVISIADPAEEGSHDGDAITRPADVYDFSDLPFDLATGRVRVTR